MPQSIVVTYKSKPQVHKLKNLYIYTYMHIYIYTYALLCSYALLSLLLFCLLNKSEKGPSLSSSTNRDVLKKVGVP